MPPLQYNQTAVCVCWKHLPKALAIAMLSSRPMKGITASPPPKSWIKHTEKMQSAAFLANWDNFGEVKVATLSFNQNLYHRPASGFISLLLTSTISPKGTMVPLAVMSEVGGGLNGGSPWEVFPVIVNTWWPETSQENATRDAATTTRALRTGQDGREWRD